MKRQYKLVAGVLLSLTLLVGCSDAKKANGNNKAENNTAVEAQATNNQKNNEMSEEAVSLSDWEGSWNSIEGYLDDEKVSESFKILAEREKMSEEEVKMAYINKRHADFKGMKIEGNKVTLFDGFEDKNGKEIETVEYEYTNQHNVKHGNHDLQWDVFKAKDANAKYPVLLMMPVHGEEELTHFHMRYGNDENELLEKDDWYPTFVKPSSTIEQIAEEVAE